MLPSHIEVYYQDRCVGRVKEESQGTSWQYDRDFIQSGIELSPLALPLRQEPYFRGNQEYNYLPGILSDVLPDVFGLKILEEYFERRGLPKPTPVSRLAYVGDHGIGALIFKPALQGEELKEEISLIKLDYASRMLNRDDGSFNFNEVMRQTSTVGGAKRKALISYDANSRKYYPGQGRMPNLLRLIVKFQTDPEDLDTHIEHAYSLMARLCGIRVVETYLIREENEQGVMDHLAVKRFDIKEDLQRLHFHSYSGITEGDYAGALNPDYAHLIRIIRQLTGRYEESLEMFRRCVYNVLVSNGDDHQKNHGFLFDGKEWRLSPAYDLTYSLMGDMSVRAMPMAGAATTIGREELFRLAKLAGIQSGDRDEAIEQVRQGVHYWRAVAEDSGLDSYIVDEIEQAIAGNVARL